MKKIKCVILTLVLLITGQAFAQRDKNGIIKVGDTVPEFTMEMTDGSTVNIEDLRGKVVWLNFGGTKCGPCRLEYERFPEEVVAKFEDKDFILLPISGESLEIIREFQKQNGYEYPMGIDPGLAISGKFAQSGVPRNYLIDKQGMVFAAELGYSVEHFDELVELVKMELKK